MRVGWSEVFGLATRRESKSNTQNNVIRSKQKNKEKYRRHLELSIS